MDIAWTPKQYARVVDNLGRPPTCQPSHSRSSTSADMSLRRDMVGVVRRQNIRAFGLGDRPSHSSNEPMSRAHRGPKKGDK